MTAERQEQVEAAEAALLAALLEGDVAALDRLLAENLIFTDQNGRQIGKAEGLEAHRSGMLRLSRVEGTERTLRLAGDTAVVTMHVELAGRWDGNAFAGAFRYTRVWLREGGAWQLLAAHGSGVG